MSFAKRTITGSMIFLVLFIPGAGLSFSKEKVAFTVGVEDYENFMPYSQYKNGRYDGLGKAILDIFASENGYVFTYEVYPLKRRDRLFTEGKLDLIFPDNPHWVPDLKRGLDVRYVPMLPYTDGVVVLPRNRGRGKEGLKRLGMPLGFTPYQYLADVWSGKIELQEGSYRGLHAKVISGRIDGAYVNIRIARYYWRNMRGTGEKRLVFDPDLPHAKGYWSLSSIKYHRVLEAFSAFLEKNEDRINTLKKEYRFDIAPPRKQGREQATDLKNISFPIPADFI